MSLNGDLKHFPIIDIIQLLHGSRKCGVLRLSSDKGESQLVFHHGDMVSANFLNHRVQIGQVLVKSGAITEKQLQEALDIQKDAGSNRKPLVITMLEHKMVDESAAYNCIESLIEMTVVEVLTWKEGSFSLEIADTENPGSYHFSRSNFQQRILLNSQGILMESLRIYDEKVRDGSMDEILSIAGVSNSDIDSRGNSRVISPAAYDPDNVPSAMQQLLMEQRNMVQRSGDQSYREVDAVKKLIVDEFPSAPKDLKRQLLASLAGTVPEAEADRIPPGIAVIVITQSQLLSTMVRSVCFQEGIYAVATENSSSLNLNIRLLLCQALHLVIFLDVPHNYLEEDIIGVCRDMQKYPQASVVLTACSSSWDALSMRLLSMGIRGVIPSPCKVCAGDGSIRQALSFCSCFGEYLRTLSTQYGSCDDQRFFACISALQSSKSRTEMSVAVLEYLIRIFVRGIVFVVTETELVAENSFGINDPKSAGIALLTKLKIPLDDQEIFENAVRTGQMYYGFHSDSTWPHQLYRLVGRPESPEVLIFPFVRVNSVVALIYADFGKEIASSPSLHYLDALAQYTTAQISVTAYRQKLRSLMDGIEAAKGSAVNTD